MKSFTTSELRNTTGAVVDAVIADEIVQLTRNGRTVAYVISDKTYAAAVRRPGDNPLKAATVTLRDFRMTYGLDTIGAAHAVNQLIADPDWGIPRVIARQADQDYLFRLHQDAVDEMVNRLKRSRERREEYEAHNPTTEENPNA